MANPITLKGEAKVIAALRADAEAPGDPQARERVLRRLEASLEGFESGTSPDARGAADAPASLIALRNAAAPSHARIRRLGPAWRTAAVLTALGAVAAASAHTAIRLLSQQPIRPSSATSSAKRPSVSRPPGPAPATKPPTVDEVASPTTAEPRHRTPTPSSSAGRSRLPSRRDLASPASEASPAKPSSAAFDSALSAEVTALGPARSALAAGDYDAALAATDAHARQFPGGVLAQEREALAIQALGRAGRTAEAQERARRFQQRYPTSTLLDTVRNSIGLNP